MNVTLAKVRLIVCAFLGSLLLHTLVILAIDLEFEDPQEEFRTLDIQLVAPTAVTAPSSEDVSTELPPHEIDLIGDSSIAKPTPMVQATEDIVDSVEIQESVDNQQETTMIPQPYIDSPTAQAMDLELDTSTSHVPQVSIRELMNATAAIVAEQSNNQRVRNIATTDEAVNTEEEYYLKAWLKKVQEVGQLNYPQAAVEQKLYGKLRLYVAVNPDGSVQETKVLRSSGHEVLDEAALRIVSLAAPFAAFPKSMRESLDLLEVVREWEFRKEALVPTTQTDED